ncbi:hypothetical protein ACH5RR_021723 [Cinchona calisaya]|uniref:Glycine-rich protein n=1 Tax=Cinchona calisaya TaxID=153742 RepID=A0ABD2ZI45_9GENT
MGGAARLGFAVMIFASVSGISVDPNIAKDLGDRAMWKGKGRKMVGRGMWTKGEGERGEGLGMKKKGKERICKGRGAAWEDGEEMDLWVKGELCGREDE